jgi:hypothetical protein
MVKNLNATHRVEGIATQYNLPGALKAAKAKNRALST